MQVKFTVFSALRNPGRFLVSTLCIAAAMTLILSALAFDYAKDAIDAGLVSYEGQGRDKYGR